MQACSFFSNPFSGLEFCFLTLLFLPPYCCTNSCKYSSLRWFDTLKIPVHCFGTPDTLKKVICLILLYTFLLLLCHFHMNINIQNSWPHWSSTYCWQFSKGSRFHGTDWINPEVTPILGVAIITLCALLGRFHPPDSFAKQGKPPPLFSMCYSGCTDSSGQFVLNVCSVGSMACPPYWQHQLSGLFWMFIADFCSWLKNSTSNEEMPVKMFCFVIVVSRPFSIPSMDVPHIKCSLCNTYLCIVVTPQFCTTQCLECFPPKQCITEYFQEILLAEF